MATIRERPAGAEDAVGGIDDVHVAFVGRRDGRGVQLADFDRPLVAAGWQARGIGLQGNLQDVACVLFAGVIVDGVAGHGC